MSTKCAATIILTACMLASISCSGNTRKLTEQLGDSDPQVRRAAVQALARRNEPDERVVSALGGVVGDDDLVVRETAITTLGQFGGEARSTLDALKTALDDPELSVRLAAALAIAKIDPEATAHRQVLLESLRSGQAPIFLEIGKLGADGDWAVATLVQLTSHPQTQVRALSARALGEIGIASDEVTAALNKLLRDREQAVCHAAETALEQLGAQNVK